MQRICLRAAVATLALTSVATAQFSVATSAARWSARPSPSNAGAGSGHLYGYSDCSSENALGLTNGGELAWFQGFQHVPANRVITCVQVAQGHVTGTGAPAGSLGAVMVYDDPGTDFTDPTDITGADLEDLATWTTCCPNTNIKEDTLILATVIDGFWLAAYLPHAAGEFPAAFDSDTPSMSRSWVTGSNTTFDPWNPGGGIGFFEMGALGFDAVWLIAGDGGGDLTILYYCTAKSGLVCGTPAMSRSGVAKVDSPHGHTIRAAPAPADRVGLLLYSCSGRANIPFDGGLLCVDPNPLRRSTSVNSGGTSGQCDGVFSIDFNTFASGNLGGNPDPCLAIPWQVVYTQWWGRDSVATGSFLSNALQFSMTP